MTLYVVTGANGFIGRHLVASLVADGVQVRALTRKQPGARDMIPGIEWVVGDTADRETWERLVEKDCIVVNLAFSNTRASAAAVEATAEMVEVCANAGIAHLIHCSTVSVYGRADETILTESSRCTPLDAYGQVKLRVEQVLADKVRGRFSVTIIRPSAVFGEGGEALIKLLDELIEGSRTINYLRSSMFGRRKTHLVPVETVVAALRFIGARPGPDGIEMFIVSDDDDPFNNFRDVERVLMDELKLPSYRIPRLPLPRFLLETLMRFMGRANVNTQTEYRCDKLSNAGFVKPVTLKAALQQFAATHIAPHGHQTP
ncbi:NAD-dependent epimerase/dehydratase family protein [Polaromonas sp. LjRoot131]|uniref:NAD-dependent epimerase/dehydratase family protein n=1 Tax=Polaromonas sp. LjRoot131 TaxID=3342262 RepID=UPI003ECF9D6B